MKDIKDRLADALFAYRDRFGEAYTVGYGNDKLNDEDIIKDIRTFIRLGLPKRYGDDDKIY